jgi:hypothetical protein
LPPSGGYIDRTSTSETSGRSTKVFVNVNGFPVEANAMPDTPLLEGIGGRYFEDCNEAAVFATQPTVFRGGVAPYAIDPDHAERLWTITVKLIA